ncbi:MAG: hypothetical protein ACPL7O_09710, partial [Armatimonadota bacterium]
ALFELSEPRLGCLSEPLGALSPVISPSFPGASDGAAESSDRVASDREDSEEGDGEVLVEPEASEASPAALAVLP